MCICLDVHTRIHIDEEHAYLVDVRRRVQQPQDVNQPGQARYQAGVNHAPRDAGAGVGSLLGPGFVRVCFVGGWLVRLDVCG